MTSVNDAVTPGSADPFVLRPDQLPRRLELELPQELLEPLQRSADRSGRSLNELLLELLDRALHPQQP
jgi:hypothetical protein